MWSMLFGVASSVLKGKQQQAEVEARNKAERARWEFNIGVTQESLGTLDYRTQVADSEVIRDRVQRNIAITQAAKKAKGETVVSAAQIGAAGRRVELGLERETGRLKADAISESNINTQVQFNNITNYFNDTAQRMVDNLNSSRPTFGEPPNTSELLLNAGMTALGTYANMGTEGRKEFRDTLSKLTKVKRTYKPEGYGATPAGIMS